MTFLLSFVAFLNFGQTTISDNTNISGNWTIASSPYIIEGRAIVPNGQTLTIEPGVEVRLKSSASPTPSWFDYSSGNVGVIRVQGEIIANGTTSNPILFTRNNTGFWGTLLMDENAASTSSFSNCIIEYAKESRNITGINSPVTFNGGISVFKSEVSISQTKFRDNNINGLYVREVANSFDFSNNTFHDNGSNGSVIEQSTVNAINNTYFNNSNNATGFVSAIRSSNSTVYLVGNLIYNNDDFGVFTSGGGNHYVVNNTIFGNSQGIRVETGANTFIHNSIIENNTLNFATSSVGGATVEMQYSLTDDSSFPINVADVAGNIVNSNASFINSGASDFSLQATSPCIDNGNPNPTGLNIPNDDVLGNNRIDNNTIDIGATEFQQSVTNFTVTTEANPAVGGTTIGGGTFANGSNVTVTATSNTGYSFLNWTENGTEVSTSSSYGFALSSDRDLVANFELTSSINENAVKDDKLIIYPNPTSGLVTVHYDDFLSIELYGAFGNFILKSSEKTINLMNQPSGVYFLKIQYSNGLETLRKIIKH